MQPLHLFGFTGMGNMAGAMLDGCLDTFVPEQIAFTRRDDIRGRELADHTGVTYYRTVRECAQNAKVIILAVKPYTYPEVLPQIAPVLKEEHIVVSLAPGITIASLKESLGENVRIVRAMPNTPAAVGEGMTGLTFSKDDFTEDERELLERFFSSFGLMQEVPESLMDAVTAASGSSPAFVYMFIEALADGVCAAGMPRAQAYTFVSQAVLGAAKMVLETGQHPGALKDAVCSPGGTTIAGVAALEKAGFRSSLIEAALCVFNKSHGK